MPDRRSGSERRRLGRKPISIEIEWEGSGGQRRNGTISDINRGGCFVLSGGEVTDGERVRLFLPIADGMKAEFAGEVANHVFEIGFAVSFRALSDAQRLIIVGLIADSKK